MAADNPALLPRLIRKFSQPGATMVLDLEDALLDVADERETAALKSGGRNALLSFAAAQVGIFKQFRIGVRVNRFDDPNFARDVDALAELDESDALECIILPKVESPEDIARAFNAISQRGIAPRQRIIIVESCKGVKRLDEIVMASNEIGVHYACYGHYDYCLNAHVWPFHEFDERDYWDHVAPIIQAIESGGLRFLHPPSALMQDEAALARVADRLHSICYRPFAFFTISGQQTRFLTLYNPQSRHSLPELRVPQRTDDERTRLAEATRQVFESRREAGVSYVVDPESGRFMPPHVYIAAVRYLNKVHIESSDA